MSYLLATLWMIAIGLIVVATCAFIGVYAIVKHERRWHRVQKRIWS